MGHGAIFRYTQRHDEAQEQLLRTFNLLRPPRAENFVNTLVGYLRRPHDKRAGRQRQQPEQLS